MNDPFEPSKPEYSLDKPEILPPIKYPEFEKLHYTDKLEILTDGMVNRDSDYAIELLLRDLGISWEQYKQVISNEEYVKLLKDKSTREKFAPYIPHIMETLGREAAAGNDAKLKNALQTMGSMAPDNLTLINQNISNMSTEELKLEAEKLVRELSGE